MNCPKCNQPMKEYHGLVETGWDCVNANCGEQTISKDILPGKNPLLVDNDSMPMGWDWGYPSSPVVTDPGPAPIKLNIPKINVTVPSTYPQFDAPLSTEEQQLAEEIRKALEEAVTKILCPFYGPTIESVPDDHVFDAMLYLANQLRYDMERLCELQPMVGLSAMLDQDDLERGNGIALDKLAERKFGIYRYFDETDEDLRFRLKASLDT